MKHRSTLLRGVCAALAMVLVFALTQDTQAQRIRDIPPGFGTINSVISSDTLPSGARVDSNTVYQLQRGGYYILNGSMDHRYPIIIKAAPGVGARPMIVQGVPGGGTVPTEAWVPRANLTMVNVKISAMDELGGNHERIFRIRENRVRIVIDSCWLDVASQAGFRFDATGAKVYFTNSIISNIGTGDSPDNGRGFDDRGNDIDTLVVENSTFYNLTSRVIRDAGGITNYCKMNHCTSYNIGQWGTSFGQCYVAIYTNNIMYNGGYYGVTPSGVVRRLVELLPLTGGGVQTADIRNDLAYLDSAVINVYPDTVSVLTQYDSSWTSYIQSLGTGATMTSQIVHFTNVPDAPVAVVTDWYTNPAPPNPGLDTTGGPFDFAYLSTDPAYTGGSDGKPLGDLNWFGIPLVGVEEQPGEELPAAFRLYDNYPNPFNPETNIRFDLSQRGNALLEVYSALGQRVATLANGPLEAGSYSVRWSGTTDNGARVASGTYIYRLSANGAVAVKKMVLVK